jgi:hypothetical protein
VQISGFVNYLLLSGKGKLRLGLGPAMHFRSHDAQVSERRSACYKLSVIEDQFEITGSAALLGEYRSLNCLTRYARYETRRYLISG